MQWIDTNKVSVSVSATDNQYKIIYQFQVSALDAKLDIIPHVLFEQCTIEKILEN